MNTRKTKRVKPLTKAQQKLIVDHIPFAERLGEHYAELGRSRGIRVEELQQDARYALCEAALRFNPRQGTDFRSYAFKWCLKYIMMTINRQYLGTGDDIEALPDDVLEDDDEDQKNREEKVDALLATLNDQEEEVVRMLYGLGSGKSKGVDCTPKSFKEVAIILDIHPARVHQIYDKAMGKMEFNS